MMLKVADQHVHGMTFSGNGRVALLLKDVQPVVETADSLYLRFALVTRGREEHILPAFILDDWGKEIHSPKLYEWVAEFGDQFPRAEIFGFEVNGLETQCFLREMELYARLPCYVYRGKAAPVAKGVLVEAILLPEASVTAPRQIKRPSGWKRPLQAARVSWWQVPSAAASFDFNLLDTPPDPGF